MIEINWKADYKKEFICPLCHQLPLALHGEDNNGKQRFYCSSCDKRISISCRVKACVDPKTKIIWYRREKIDSFICPDYNCNKQNICFTGFAHGKAQFRCRECRKLTFDSVELSSGNISRYAHVTIVIKPFNLEDDLWDLRAILSTFDDYDRRFFLNFKKVKGDWFKILVKQFDCIQDI